MAIFHCAIQIISRGKGKSAVAAAAYRSGTKMTNEYDGVIHDYTKKSGIFASAILLPSHAPKEYADRNTLWNAVEKIENTKRSQLAREIEVAIPKEIPQGHWKNMMIEYCKTNFVSKGMIADLSIHNKDVNNPHCHIMLTMRPIEVDGKWGAKSRKEYVLDAAGNRVKLPSGNWKSTKVDTTDWNSRDNAELWRKNWSEHCNRYLEKLGHVERIDHRSYERQGIDKIPQIHLGVSASQMEQKGIVTDRGNLNREIINDNKQMQILRARVTRLVKWQRELKAQPLDLTQVDIKESVLRKLYANRDVNASRYKRLKLLESDNKIYTFMMTHKIETMEDFTAKLMSLNESFYALQQEAKVLNGAVDYMNKRIALWDEYGELKSFRKKHQKLQGKAKHEFYNKYKNQIERAETLHKFWSDFVATGEKINTKEWKKYVAYHKSDIGICEWKMKALKEELGSAERVKRMLEEERSGVSIVEITQERAKEREL